MEICERSYKILEKSEQSKRHMGQRSELGTPGGGVVEGRSFQNGLMLMLPQQFAFSFLSFWRLSFKA